MLLTGKIHLPPPIPDPPLQLQTLLTEYSRIGRYFRNNICRFNAGMYMAIMKATNATMHVCREALAIANF
jgi:hypothetical protein